MSYVPPATTANAKGRPKFAERTDPGIVPGYEVGHRGIWRGGYVVAPLESFVGLSLHHKANLAKVKNRITTTDDVHVVPGTKPWFPLVERADCVSRTLAGIEESLSSLHKARAPSEHIAAGETIGTGVIHPDDEEQMEEDVPISRAPTLAPTETGDAWAGSAPPVAVEGTGEEAP